MAKLPPHQPPLPPPVEPSVWSLMNRVERGAAIFVGLVFGVALAVCIWIGATQ